MKWFWKWRLDRLKVCLAGAQAKSEAISQIARSTGFCYPVTQVRLAEQIGRLQCAIGQVEERLR